MQTDSPATRNDGAITEGLAEAAAAAGYAPSIRNTQPWRWRIGTDTLDLYLHRERVLAGADPVGRLATLSCGAALYYARASLAAEGWHATVARMPDAADQEHLASVRVYAPAVADPQAMRQRQAFALRHTDQRQVSRLTVSVEGLRAVVASAQSEGAWLQLLSPDQLAAVVTAAGLAEQGGVAPEWQAELAYWAGGSRPESGRSESPLNGDHTDRPLRIEQDGAATFAILYGRSDEPRDWVRGGEALGAAWLTATERGISVLPLSAPVEVAGTRDVMRRILSYLNHPFLVLRLGTVDSLDTGAPQPPRLPVDQIVDSDRPRQL